MSLFNRTNKTPVSSPKRSCRARSLTLEPLEARELLSVSQGDYEAIRGLYSEFNLPASMNDLNVMEMESSSSSSFNLAELQSLIDDAESSDSDDLIVVRANSNRNTLTYSDTYKDLTINIPEGKGKLTIVAYEAGSDKCLTLNASSKSRCLTVESGEVQIGNVFMKNGKATTGGEALVIGTSRTYEFGTGGGIYNSGTLQTKDVVISNCKASCAASTSSFYINTVFSLGGGIFNTGSMSMYSSTVTGNKAESSGITYSQRTLHGFGGGVYNEGGFLSFVDCEITGNVAQSDRLTKTITDNDTTETEVIQQEGQAGGLYNAGGTVHLTRTSVLNNTAYMDAGIYNDATQEKNPTGGVMTITDSTVSGHSSQEGAGGIYNNTRCELTIIHSFIQGNSTAEWGGGIQSLGTLTVVNSVVSGNTATANGGGISAMGGSVTGVEINIVNTTITGNKVTGDTSSDPQVKGRGAGLYFDGNNGSATAIVSNSIIVNNLLTDAASEDSNIYVEGNGPVTGNNNLSTFTQWTGSNNNSYDSSIPLFLRDYDFNTRTEGDYRLETNSQSQAINKGNNELAAAQGLTISSKDMGGEVRINENIIDPGAYECQGRIVPPTVLNPPATVYAQARTATSITVTWSPVEHAFGYVLEYQQSDDTNWTTYTGHIAIGSLAVSGTVTGLTQNMDYRFRVKATGDGLDYDDSTEWTITTSMVRTYVDTLVVATNLDLNDNDDSILSLREAVAWAGTSGWGTNISFASGLNGATISLTQGDLIIERDMTINAGSLSRGVTLEKSSLIVGLNRTVTLTKVNVANVTQDSDITGAIQVKGTLVLHDSQVADNTTRGIYVDGGTVTLNNCLVEGNDPQSQTDAAGGIWAENATVAIIDSVVRQNGSFLIGLGGGIYAKDSDLSLKSSSIEQNDSSCGGGIYFEGSDKTLSILSSKLTGNGALTGAPSVSGGGGIYLAAGTLNISNSLVAGNKAYVNEKSDPGGSGIYFNGTYGFSLVNSTVTGNRVVSNSYDPETELKSAAIVVTNTESAVFSNSIIAGNSIVFTTYNEPLVTDLNSSHTILGKNSVTTEAYTNWTSDSVHNDHSTAEALFIQPAQWSDDYVYLSGNYNLLSTAKAINTGDDSLAVAPDDNGLIYDVDGNARKVDTVDIGAFEAPVSTTPRAVISAPDVAMEGCAVFLDASESVANNGSTISKYLWDLDGDGEFGENGEEQQQSLWFDLARAKERNYAYDGSQYTCTLGLIVENANEVQSLPVYHTVNLSAFHISIDMSISFVSNEVPVAKLSITASLSSGNNVCSWIVDWGDGIKSTYHALTNRVAIPHYYADSGTHSIKVCVIDTDGLGHSSWFSAGSYTPSADRNAQLAADYAAIDAAFAEPEMLIQDDLPTEEIAQIHCSNNTATDQTIYDADLLVLQDDVLRKNKIFMGVFTS